MYLQFELHKGQSLALFFFILFISDLEYVLSDKASFKLFVDDFKIYSTFNIPSCYNNLQHALGLLVLWSESWQFPINLSKIHLLHLGTSINVHTYLVNGVTVLPADKVLDLGIITDSDLNCSSHIIIMNFESTL